MGQLFSKTPCILSIYEENFILSFLMEVFKLVRIYSQLMRNRTGNNPYMSFAACCYLKTKDFD